jgi:hypothetical protein
VLWFGKLTILSEVEGTTMSLPNGRTAEHHSGSDKDLQAVMFGV